MPTFDDLERKLDCLIKEPENFLLFNQVGVILYQVQDWKNAELYFQRAYQLNPADQDTLYNYAFLLYRQGQFQKAVILYEAYLEIEPLNQEVRQKAGDCYYLLGEYEQAVKMYRQLPEE
ncbi:MAG: tetratricopeptide repeat protein [Peptococcaceae bacterium]